MKIKEIRIKNKISQKALAKKLGILPTTLYKYENKLIEPNIDMLKSLATELGTSVDTIIDYDCPMLDLRKLTDIQRDLVDKVQKLTPKEELQVAGYIDKILEK